MDNMQPELSPPETPAENTMAPALLWKGDLSMPNGNAGRSHLQIGPMGSTGGVAAPSNAAESSASIAES